jgi:hypothetical protein
MTKTAKATKSLPKQIALIIRYRTSGGVTCPHSGDAELIEVIEDGVKREAKVTDPEIAYKWLMAQEYAPEGHVWLDKAGFLRRRKSTYIK